MKTFVFDSRISIKTDHMSTVNGRQIIPKANLSLLASIYFDCFQTPLNFMKLKLYSLMVSFEGGIKCAHII